MNPTQEFTRLLAGSKRNAALKERVTTLLRSDPQTYLPIAIHVAQEHHDETGHLAAKLLNAFFHQDTGFEAAFQLRDLVQTISPQLAPAATKAIRRLVVQCRKIHGSSLLYAALLRDLSRWTATSGDHKQALAHAKASVRVLRDLPKSTRGRRGELVASLRILALILSSVGNVSQALDVSTQAVRESSRLNGNHGRRIKIDALMTLAHLRSISGDAEESLQLALNGFQHLNLLPISTKRQSHVVQLLCHCANQLLVLDELAEAISYANSAYALCFELVAQDPGEFLELHLDSALVHSRCLALGGQITKSAEVINRSVKYLLDLESSHPGRFTPTLMYALTTCCSIHLDAGEVQAAIRVGELGLPFVETLQGASIAADRRLALDLLSKLSECYYRTEDHSIGVRGEHRDT